MKRRSSLKGRKAWVGGAVGLALAALNAPAVVDFAQQRYHAYEINRPEYKAKRGHWTWSPCRRGTS